MKTVVTSGTVQEVAEVIRELYNDFEGEVLIVGDGAPVVADGVKKLLKDFKVSFVDNQLDDGNSEYIKIFD